MSFPAARRFHPGHEGSGYNETHRTLTGRPLPERGRPADCSLLRTTWHVLSGSVVPGAPADGLHMTDERFVRPCSAAT